MDINKLSSLIKDQKDKLPTYSRSNIVNCQECNASYVGQTKRLLKTKISEHRNTLIEISQHSRLSQNIEQNYEFDWNNVI